MVTNELKQRIVKSINDFRINYQSDAKMAVALGISAAQLSVIKKGQLDRVLSDANWLSIARRLEVQIGEASAWQTAKTAVFLFVTQQLGACQAFSTSGLLCDRADIGKTYAARQYARENKNAVYIDCSQVKSKQKLVRQIAKEFGVNHTGRYADVYEDLVYFLRSAGNPLIILDEAGDLDYAAFLELKALWNATERCCGWYMIGADGLKNKIENNLHRRKVGYAELFSRFGSRYQKITPDGSDAWEDFSRAQVAQIAKSNAEEVDVQGIYHKTQGSLRRIYIEIRKKQKGS